MWRSWGSSQPTYGAEPNYIPYEQEESYLETIPEVDSRPTSTNVASLITFNAGPSIHEISRSDDESAYEPPSPRPMPTHAHARIRELHINTNTQIQRGSTEISPLSTPGSYQDTFSNRESISPIEGVAHPFARDPIPDQSRTSQIPRRIVSNKQQKQERKDQTRWDDYSGEPTRDDRGKLGSARPGEDVAESQYPHLKERTKQILASIRQREAANKQQPTRVWGKPPPPVEDPLDNPQQREPWRGASGRTPLVEPVRNTPDARQGPITFPPRNVSRTNTIDLPTSDETLPTDSRQPLSAPPAPEMTAEYQMAAFMNRRNPEYNTESNTPPNVNNEPQYNTSHMVASLRSMESEESLRPIVPLKRNAAERRQEQFNNSATQHSFEGQHSPPAALEPPQPYYENVRTESPAYEPEPTTPTTPTRFVDPENIEEDPSTPTGLAPSETDHEVSRFSWTTYATSVADTPRSTQYIRDSSTPPPVPAIPYPLTIQKKPTVTNPYAHEGPYMHASGAYSTGSVVLRKPVPANPSPTPMTAAERAASVSKDLPLVPDQVEAADKIAGLEATIEALNRRKGNITRIIRDLEESLKRNNVNYDIFKHREVEKTIANHRKEMDSITQGLHDNGIQLHRAQRKRDKADSYEDPTGLWIKRVTS